MMLSIVITVEREMIGISVNSAVGKVPLADTSLPARPDITTE